MSNFKLSPSDFAFLWEECPRCFYLKYVEGFKRPSGAFPSIFTVIDREMRKTFLGQRADAMTPDLPPGTMAYGEKWVQSAPISLPGHHATITIRGKLDAVVAFDDGSFGVIDFKTSDIRARSKQLYSRQLRAYTHALENPEPGKFNLKPISMMGLLAYTPDDFATQGDNRALLHGRLQWHEIKRNDTSFMKFLDEVLTVLELPEAPEAAAECSWCKYREESRQNGL